MPAEQTENQNCAVCGKDTARVQRTRDRKGRYFCQPCYDKLLAEARARAGKAPREKPAAKPAAAAAGEGASARRMADVFSELAKLERKSNAVEDHPRPCPSCGEHMEWGTVECKMCTYNVRARRRMQKTDYVSPGYSPGNEKKGRKARKRR